MTTRALAVAALSALSAASAFAPCRGRERRAPRAGSICGGVRGGNAPPGSPRRSDGRGPFALSSTAAGSDLLEAEPRPAVLRGGGGGSAAKLMALFRRGRRGLSEVRTSPLSVAGDSVSPANRRRDDFEYEECMLNMARSGAGPGDAAEICFDPQSFDRGLDNHGMAAAAAAAAGALPGAPQAADVGGGAAEGGGAGDDVNDVGAEAEEMEPLVAESALPDPPELEERQEDDEVCVTVYDVPVTPSFELPKFPGMVNGANGEAAEEETRQVPMELEEGELEKEPRNGALCDRGLVLVDAFSPYHGQYLSSMAREAYGAGVVSVLSSYVAGYLYQEQGMTDHLPMRLPNLDDYGHDGEVERWVNKIPFEIVGIICESDSGLDDAERLGEALGLYPDRHDGYNTARRDKFLMNEACQKHGLRVVKQKMCDSVEEALEFARELGIKGKAEAEEITLEQLCDDEQHGNIERNSADLRINGASTTKNGNGHATNGKHVPNQVDVPDFEMNVGHPEDEIVNNSHHEALEQLLDDEEQGEEEEGHLMPSNEGVLGLASNAFSSSTNYCVLKPSRGVASDSVHLCSTQESVTDAFENIHGTTIFGSMHGERHESVLVQEFAAGTEYAVDIVSKAGEHKVAALWRYDKRPANGSPFVYHATEVVDADTEVGRAVSEYAMEALDALGVHWGMSHNEIIVDAEGSPRLVEVNCRQHNTDFAPLTTACVGYNALDMLLAAYLGDADEFPPNTEHKRLDWDELPHLPITRAYGAIVHLVSHVEGTLVGVNEEALSEIEGLKSVLAMEVYPQFTKVGEHIQKTVDIRTDSGWCHVMNDDPEQLGADYDRIVELMQHLFIVETQEQEGKNDVKEENMMSQLQGVTEGVGNT